ncbi:MULTISPECIES: ATP-dependent helicase [Caldilinea]|jgi:DNA helicase-2/ATP-dependent DNA helicase PcrA|uniref:DNA 3'-5' helicase n=1 Tax=Caldilinea aerophila (strain DSM 14535 / JCM 11387 / NBRC 104270 / STL-6-O1) TaxID=926550 RepID=I0I1F4_CALAS|nr:MULTISPECIES: ATP-dependent helicase [Caldilinea]BAL99091.1 putative ATP-dependent DNA helicase [Caldilinea aerophila DSM 14535 = NBRC 104270]GIV74317.1 MAG: DNA helicase [Caldilinea sp.]
MSTEPVDSQRPAFIPRPAQQQILEYTGGPMGISAVPGSGKTFTLSLLAARLVERLAAEGRLDDREVLVVTFTNSAVANFRARIGRFLRQERGLLPGVGYRVRTLHGLAHDIVRERPGLVGLSEEFEIIDERTANEIKRDAVIAYLRTHPDAFAPFIKPELLQNPRRIESTVLEDAIELANVVIRVAKELSTDPGELRIKLDRQSGFFPLLDFGLSIYATYERSLQVRGAVDFDDLILLALRALRADEGYLERLQQRWPYILEDEAQDSSLAQEKMLRLLTAAHGNWVRVGDPNQAINTTFTSADSRFLQRFLREHPEQARSLPNSGRSALPIIEVANELIRWSQEDHPTLSGDLALSYPLIEPTPPGDPQPNPPPGKPAVHFYEKALSPDEELDVIVRSVKRWVTENPDKTMAVLAPDNRRGDVLVNALRQAGLIIDDDLLRTSSSTRATAKTLATVVGYIADPQSAHLLRRVWEEVWYPQWAARRMQAEGNGAGYTGRDTLPEPVRVFGQALGKLREAEAFVFPHQRDFLNELGWLEDMERFRELLQEFRSDLQRWSHAAVLPVDELLLTVGNDLFTEPADLAVTHRLAVLLARLAAENPNWRLPDLVGELENIAQNRRRLLGFTEDSQGYTAKPGVVTVATMHAAKGLEWDRVYLTAVNAFSFPSGLPEEQYRSERWYVRDSINLAAELEAQLRQLHMGTLDEYMPGRATEQARLDLAAERLRLFYVGITRARRELIVTYNTGRRHDTEPLPPALAFSALAEFVKTKGWT